MYARTDAYSPIPQVVPAEALLLWTSIEIRSRVEGEAHVDTNIHAQIFARVYAIVSMATGEATVDLDVLKANTEYTEPLTADSPRVAFLWGALRSFSDAERRLFVNFVWASSRLPVQVQPTRRCLCLPIDASANECWAVG